MQERFRITLDSAADASELPGDSSSSSSTADHEAADGEGAIARLRDQRTIEELRELVRLLRKDKEILATKLEIVQQDLARHRQQFAQTVKNLEQVQEQLREQQLRNQTLSQTEAQHETLLRQVFTASRVIAMHARPTTGTLISRFATQVEQQQMLRESNAMLRQEKESTVKRMHELQVKYEQLSVQLEPLRDEKDRALVELEAVRAQKLAAVQEARVWERRVNDLLEKYQRIDPAEHEALKLKCETALSELATAQTSLSSLQAERTKLDESLTAELEKRTQAETQRTFD